MMKSFNWVFVVLVIVLYVGLAQGESNMDIKLGSCPVVSITDVMLGFQESVCYLHHSYDVTVIEGDEGSLQRALRLVYSKSNDYVAVLFYASWCPFSRNFRPSFSILSTLYPSIPHFAIEESAIKPSILSKYGVHGFPTLYLLNSTMRVRYRGSRSMSSLVHFYNDVVGIEGDPRDELPFDKIVSASNQERNDNSEIENYPFSWAKYLENLFQRETYLALATTFVLLRLVFVLIPYVLEFARCTWRRYMEHVRVTALWEYPLRYLNKSKQVLSSCRGPRKGSNFQEGAINARAWASKSLASAVSIGGDASASRAVTSASH
ncbi:hypothetical protein KSS87_008148 [Heliosperma pusillum]|nr:hypothetical protein KSS87_008148 [Heliosperma pusillum]